MSDVIRTRVRPAAAALPTTTGLLLRMTFVAIVVAVGVLGC
jgi:hypothetical protein